MSPLVGPLRRILFTNVCSSSVHHLFVPSDLREAYAGSDTDGGMTKKLTVPMTMARSPSTRRLRGWNGGQSQFTLMY